MGGVVVVGWGFVVLGPFALHPLGQYETPSSLKKQARMEARFGS